jgi:hypothetical protein
MCGRIRKSTPQLSPRRGEKRERIAGSTGGSRNPRRSCHHGAERRERESREALEVPEIHAAVATTARREERENRGKHWRFPKSTPQLPPRRGEKRERIAGSTGGSRSLQAVFQRCASMCSSTRKLYRVSTLLCCVWSFTLSPAATTLTGRARSRCHLSEARPDQMSMPAHPTSMRPYDDHSPQPGRIV